MYSQKLTKLLEKSGIATGDRIRLECTGETQEGILMPRAGESDDLVIKLDSGYNIGVNPEGKKLTLIEKAEPKHAVKEAQQKRGDIAILGCGGTIASKVEYKTGAVFPTTSPKDLVNMFPELRQMSSIHGKVIFSLLSEDMTAYHWRTIAGAVAEEIKEGANGVVLMHGTDVMHHTSAALSFALQNLPVPVVLVGAQRSSDRPSSDNKDNLLNAVFAAKSDIAHVGLCMHANSDDSYAHLHLGTKARKMHTSRRDAFQSINSPPLAKVDYKSNKIEPLLPYIKRGEARKLDLQNHFSDNVALLFTYPGIKPSLIDKFADYDGLVLAATGLGHVPSNPFNDKHANNIIPNIKALVDSGVPVVISPQTLYGRLGLHVYSAGRVLEDAGVIGNGADWTPETAYVKLSWVLGKEKKMDKVRELMMKNVAGEITPRTGYDENIIDL